MTMLQCTTLMLHLALGKRSSLLNVQEENIDFFLFFLVILDSILKKEIFFFCYRQSITETAEKAKLFQNIDKCHSPKCHSQKCLTNVLRWFIAQRDFDVSNWAF
jgi:hypothetical protein